MVHSTREQAQESVQDECQDGRGYATDEHRFEVAGLKTTEDVVTQAQTTNRRRESRHADSPGHRRTNPGNDYRQGQWKPHAQQLFSRPHTNRARDNPAGRSVNGRATNVATFLRGKRKVVHHCRGVVRTCDVHESTVRVVGDGDAGEMVMMSDVFSCAPICGTGNLLAGFLRKYLAEARRDAPTLDN